MRSGTLRLGAFSFSAGLALLSAEVVWNRTLLILTGGSVDSTAVVLSATMAGLALGGVFWGVRGERSENPLRMVRRLAFACAATFLAPALFAPLFHDLSAALGSHGLPPAVVRAVTAAFLVLPPAFLAGGIVPLLARLVEGAGGVRRIAGLYAFNTAGSALGGLLTGFVLLEALGARASLILSSGLMVVSALMPGRSAPAPPLSGAPVPVTAGPRPLHAILYAASGMIALAWESVWARQLTFILGNSTYAFSLMGASVLAGLSLGSLAGRRLRGSPLSAFGLCVAGEGVAGALPLALSALQPVLAGLLPPGYRGPSMAALAVLSMIPASVLMGATFPLMVRAAGREGTLGADVGLLAMANSLGAAAGPFFGSWLVLGWFGPTAGSGFLAVAASLTGTVAAAVDRRRMSTALVPVLAVPALAAAVLLAPPGSRSPSPDLRLLFFDEARTATVAVFGRDWDGHRSLRINGVEEVPVDQASMEAFHLLGHLPWGYRPGADSVLVIALGGGITAGSLLSHDIGTLTCVEICPSVAEALPLFAPENGRPDLDPRFGLVGDDGRNFLAVDGSEWDLIVCDATHPGSSDSWVLYTREFYLEMRSHLGPGGVAAQWVPLHQLPVEDFGRILRTWGSVFPSCRVHLAGGRHVVLVGSDSCLTLDIDAMFDTPAARAALESSGFDLDDPDPLTEVASEEDLARLPQAGGLNTDDRAPCQFIRRRVRGGAQATIAPCVLMLLSLRGGTDHLRNGQILYWSGRLGEAAAVLEEAPHSSMTDRWLAVALVTAAEEMGRRGLEDDALRLLDRAERVDPAWPRPGMLRTLLRDGGVRDCTSPGG